LLQYNIPFGETAHPVLGAGEPLGRRESMLSPCSRCHKGRGTWIKTRATANKRQRCREGSGASTGPLG